MYSMESIEINNSKNIPKKQKKKRVYTEEELALTRFYKDMAVRAQQNFKSKCKCPPGFKGDGAFCPVHRD